MNKRLGIVRRFVLLTLLAAIFCLNIPVSYASTHESISKEKLYSLNSSQLVSLLEDNGLRLPQDYAEHRELASSFVSKYTPLIIWIVPKKVDTKNKKSISIYTPLPSQMVRAYC